jgi:Leucine-rich repeat (LRR) protein
MNEIGKFALVKRPSSAIEKAAPGAKRVLADMVSDTLTLTLRKFRVAEYDLCEPDYLQLMAWAEQLKLSPDEVLRRLKSGLKPEGCKTIIENGCFIKLHWDPGLLPLSEFQISQKLRLIQLSFTPIEGVSDLGAIEAGVGLTNDLPDGYDLDARILGITCINLPRLRFLECSQIGLKAMRIERATFLESFGCWGNSFESIDLKPFPNLKTLNCLSNQLTSLDLSDVPKLNELDCQLNLIKNLDLSPVSKLQKLNCSDNDMREFILPNVPDLIELECKNSSWDKDAGLGRYLEKIDLRGAPKLKLLNCRDNMLEHLELSCVPKLKCLECSWNPLTELDLAGVPLLETLKCHNIPSNHWTTTNPPRISSLDVSGLHHLKELDYDNRTQVIQRPDQYF